MRSSKDKHKVVPQWYHVCMSTTIQQLVEQLESAGFTNRGGKGRHQSFRHAKGVNITLSGKNTQEAKPYQINESARAIEKTRNEKK